MTTLFEQSNYMIVIIFGSSLVDYPLRTPLLSALFALACGWLAHFAHAEPGAEHASWCLADADDD